MSKVDLGKYLNMGDVNPNTELRENEPKNDVPPEEELFHAIYISGKTRTEPTLNNKKIYGGFLQVRGVEYNLEEVYMMPYYKRSLLVKNEKIGKYDSTVCFSFFDFDEKGNQISTSGFPCPPTSPDRKEVSWCNNCKMHIVIIGFLCDENGKVKRDSDGNPFNVFLRVSGSKVGDVMKYLFECKELEVPYLFPDGNEEAKKQEIEYFNILRRCIKITVEETPTYVDGAYDQNKMRYAYKLEGMSELPPESIFKLLDYAENLDEEIREKFDWSEKAKKNVKKIKQKLQSFQASPIFRDANPDFKPSGGAQFMTFDDPPVTPPSKSNKESTSQASSFSSENNNDFDPDDIPF